MIRAYQSTKLYLVTKRLQSNEKRNTQKENHFYRKELNKARTTWNIAINTIRVYFFFTKQQTKHKTKYVFH